jgi:hypothetical protein
MHAMVETIHIDPEAIDVARSLIREQVTPRVAAAAGFVAGYWLEPLEGKAMSIIVFEEEEQARATAPPVGLSPVPGMVVESVDVAVVMAHAQGGSTAA